MVKVAREVPFSASILNYSILFFFSFAGDVLIVKLWYLWFTNKHGVFG